MAVAAQAPLGRGARAVVYAAATALTAVAGVMTILAAADAEIVLRGTPATATVVEAGEQQRSRNLWIVQVKLAVQGPDRQELLDWAARPLRVTGGWSDPPRPPVPGNRVAVRVVPDTPPRIVPLNAIGDRYGWAAKLAFAWLLAAAAWLAVRRVRRTRMA